MSDERPAGVLAQIPRFQQPQRRRLDPSVPEDENPTPSPSDSPILSDQPNGLSLGLGGPTRTSTSGTPGTDEKPSTKDTAELLAGIIAVVAVGVAFVVRWRLKANLREPTEKQAEEIAKPLARIGLRHVPAAKLNPDLLDATQAAAAFGKYLKAGPLLERAYDNPGDIPQGDE